MPSQFEAHGIFLQSFLASASLANSVGARQTPKCRWFCGVGRVPSTHRPRGLLHVQLIVVSSAQSAPQMCLSQPRRSSASVQLPFSISAFDVVAPAMQRPRVVDQPQPSISLHVAPHNADSHCSFSTVATRAASPSAQQTTVPAYDCGMHVFVGRLTCLHRVRYPCPSGHESSESLTQQ